MKAFAAHNPSCIYLCARTPSSAEPVVKAARAEHPDTRIEILRLDLSSFDSIKKCAAEVNQKSSRVDFLLLNAGIAGVAAGLTKEGYEVQFGVNHLGHALLTQVLMPKMLQTVCLDGSDVRIIVTTSLMAHNSSPEKGLDFDAATNADAFDSAMKRYGHSKLANILFARKLAQLYPTITSTSQHPGIVSTEGYFKADIGIPNFVIRPLLWMFAISPDKGAQNGLWCATAKIGDGGVENGQYYEPVGKHVERNKNATDQQMADRLWDWTAKELVKHGAPGWPAS